MKFNNIKGSLILILAALIWGLAFVAQSGAAELVPPFTFNAVRSFIGAFALYIFYLIMNRREKKPFFPQEKVERGAYFRAALICGGCLAVSINFQQFGIAFYPPEAAVEARSGFITALYVILVPIFSIFVGKKLKFSVVAGVIIAIAGVYMLCFAEGFSGIYIADLLVFLCAISFTLHIMSVDKFVAVTGGVKLSIMQFVVAGIISLILGVIFEFGDISLSNILTAAPQILYLGIMSSGVAYTLQIIGQRFAEPAIASLTMSLESVFAALGGWLIASDYLSPREIIGCALVFLATIIVQLPDLLKMRNK